VYIRTINRYGIYSVSDFRLRDLSRPKTAVGLVVIEPPAEEDVTLTGAEEAGGWFPLSVPVSVSSQPLVEWGNNDAEGRSFLYSAWWPRLASALVTWRLAASVSKRTHTMSVRTNQTGYKPTVERPLDHCPLGMVGYGR
jgi:hypothetical protein